MQLLFLYCFIQDKLTYYRRLADRHGLRLPIAPSYPGAPNAKIVEALERFACLLRLWLFPLSDRERGQLLLAQNPGATRLQSAGGTG
jgi:hypothetical protein